MSCDVSPVAMFFPCICQPESGAPVRNGWQDASERAPRSQVEAQRQQRVEEQLLHLCREPASHCATSGASWIYQI